MVSAVEGEARRALVTCSPNLDEDAAQVDAPRLVLVPQAKGYEQPRRRLCRLRARAWIRNIKGRSTEKIIINKIKIANGQSLELARTADEL